MLALREMQEQFAAGLLAEPPPALLAEVRANRLPPAARVQVYRNNVFGSLTGALEAIYPVVAKLVGEDFFRQVAREYVRRHPSRSGNLHDYGTAFPALLASLRECTALPYLPDVARLEWAYHLVFHAAAARPLDLKALNAINADDAPRLRLRLHPASRIVESPYPVLRIWQVNQENFDGNATVSLAEGGMNVLVIRRELDIEFELLSAGEVELLRAFAEGLDFATAVGQAAELQPGLDIEACLQHHITRGTITGFALSYPSLV